MTAPIFIVGSPRSGTTLLRLMLCAHPRIYVTHEASFYVCASMFPRGAPRRDFLEHYFRTGWFRWLRLDPERVLAGLPDPLPPARLREAFAAVMREKAADYGRVRFGDKTPLHCLHLKQIFADFPDARVLHIIRDPRGTALSLKQMPFGSRSLFCNAALTDLQWRTVQKFRDRVLRIRLEDLTADPRTVMQRVLEYVGEPWDDAVLDHARHLPDRNDMPPFPWTESAARAPSGPAVNWRSLSPVEIRMVEHVTRRVFREGCYERAALTEEPARMAVRWEAIRQIPEALRCVSVFLRLRWRMLRDPKQATERIDPLWRGVNPEAWARYPDLEQLAAPPPLPPPR